MKKNLEILFRKSIELGDENYTNEQIEVKWIGNPPACATDIENAENRLGIKLPNDYIEMITIANGFPTCSNSVEPSFQKVQEIDYYRNYEYNVIDTWKELGELDEVINELEMAIMIAGFEEEQQFLIIPPKSENEKWKYWKFALWIPGEEEYQQLNDYFEGVIRFLTNQIQENGT